MKKSFKMENLDCANCAAKMERAIQKIDGVHSAEVRFMAQRWTMDVDEAKLPEILEQVKKCVSKVEPTTKVLGI